MPEIAPLEIPVATGSRTIWLRVGALLDGISSAPLRDAHVVYNRLSIQFVGRNDCSPPRALVRTGQTRPDVDAPDCTLLPGLIDAHAHFFLGGGELDAGRRAAQLQQSPEVLREAARERLERVVRLGVAAVRDAGDKDGVGLALRKLYLSSARPLMPYIDSPGAAIHRRGRYGSFMAEPLEDCASLRACVQARVAAGADRIKLIATGIINFKQGRVTSAPQLTAPEISEIVAATRALGRQTFAHASGDDGIEHAIEGGVDSVEHGFFVRDDQLTRMRDRQIAWVPTFAPVRAQTVHADRLGWDAGVVGNLHAILDRHAASLVKAHELGVAIVAGSDAGSYGVAHGFGLLDELEAMEGAGLPPIAVLNAATGASATRLDYREPLGRISPGFRSRFMVTRHAPHRRIADLRKPRTIVFDGGVFETTEIDAAGL